MRRTDPPDEMDERVAAPTALSGVGLAVMVKAIELDVPPPGDGLNTVMLAVPAEAMSEAVTAKANCVLLTNEGVRLAPFHRTIELLRKLVPFTVSVNDTPPAVPEIGLRLVIVGTGLDPVMLNMYALDVPPPGEELTAVTLAVPAEAMSAAVIAAVNCVLLTKVVVRLDPFHRIVELLRKLVPFTVSVNAAPPATMEVGLRLMIAGAMMVNVCVLDVPPPGEGLTTVTLAVPAEAISAAVIAAVNCVLLTKAVVRVDPFH
jgi:hypothetical protein